MAADWGTFISNVTTILLSQSPESAPDFGNKLAAEYLSAVKTKAVCIPGNAKHMSSPGEPSFISSYEQWFQDLFEKGEPVMLTPDDEAPIVNEKQNMLNFLATPEGQETRLTVEGKDQDPDYEKLEEDIGGGISYEPSEELDKYIEDYKDDDVENLSKFENFEFHRLDGEETPMQLAKIFATRLLMQFKELKKSDERKRFWDFMNAFKESTSNLVTNYSATQSCRSKVKAVTRSVTGANSQYDIYNEVYAYVTHEMFQTHPFSTEEVYYVSGRKYTRTITEESARNKAIDRAAVKEVDATVWWPFTKELPEGYDDMEPADKLLVRYPFELNRFKIQESFDENAKMPPVLMTEVIIDMTYRDVGSRSYGNPGPKIEYYEKTELRKKWQGCPLGAGDGDQQILNADLSECGTLFKQIRNKMIAEKALEDEMLAEGGSKDDPYKELAKATLEYWKAAAVAPFAPMSPTPPCTINLPLGGLYVGVSYGNQKKLADNLRRALNSGKDMNSAPDAAAAVASALAYSYFTHLSQMKFIYLGGITVPIVPFIPMIGFDATVM